MKYMFYIWNIHWNISLGLNLANKEKITFIFLIGINMSCVMHSETYELPEKYMKAISHINSKQIYWTFISTYWLAVRTSKSVLIFQFQILNCFFNIKIFIIFSQFNRKIAYKWSEVQFSLNPPLPLFPDVLYVWPLSHVIFFTINYDYIQTRTHVLHECCKML